MKKMEALPGQRALPLFLRTFLSETEVVAVLFVRLWIDWLEPLEDCLGEFPEILCGILNGVRMAAQGSVRGGQLENRLASFRGHGNEAAVVLQAGQTVWIICLLWKRVRGLA